MWLTVLVRPIRLVLQREEALRNHGKRRTKIDLERLLDLDLAEAYLECEDFDVISGMIGLCPDRIRDQTRRWAQKGVLL